ncbi:MAG: hypothetical protein AB8H47_19830 [Bacteroidia bacterium]
MNKPTAFGLLLITVMLVFTACDRQTIVETQPSLRFVSLSTDTVVANKDSLTIRLEYEDSEGDLGDESPELRSLSIKDSRLAEADFFHVQPLAPIGAKVWIKGTLAVHIPNLFLMSVAESEEVVFTARIQDRAGNWSEPTQSPPVHIIKVK